MPGECERMQIARGMQGNARGMYGSGCKVTGECKGNVCESKVPEECRGMTGIYASGCKVLGEYRGMQWNARETYGSGCKVPGEYSRISGELM